MRGGRAWRGRQGWWWGRIDLEASHVPCHAWSTSAPSWPGDDTAVVHIVCVVGGPPSYIAAVVDRKILPVHGCPGADLEVVQASNPASVVPKA